MELEVRPEVSSQIDSLASPEPAGLVTELLYEDQLLQGVDGGQAAVLLQHSQLTISSRRTDPNFTAGLVLTEDLIRHLLALVCLHKLSASSTDGTLLSL